MGSFSRLLVVGQREGLELRHLRIEPLAEALLDVVDRRHLPTAETYAEIHAEIHAEIYAEMTIVLIDRQFVGVRATAAHKNIHNGAAANNNNAAAAANNNNASGACKYSSRWWSECCAMYETRRWWCIHVSPTPSCALNIPREDQITRP